MINYKDMTFCNSPCGNMECFRKLTNDVYNDAAAWWGTGNAPLSIASLSNVCDFYIEEKDYEQES